MDNTMIRSGLHYLAQVLRTLTIQQRLVLDQLSQAFQQYGMLTRSQQQQLVNLLDEFNVVMHLN